MKGETGGAAFNFVSWKAKMYSFMVGDNKKTKGGNRNVVATISHNEYKDILLNNECFKVKTIEWELMKSIK